MTDDIRDLIIKFARARQEWSDANYHRSQGIRLVIARGKLLGLDAIPVNIPPELERFYKAHLGTLDAADATANKAVRTAEAELEALGQKLAADLWMVELATGLRDAARDLDNICCGPMPNAAATVTRSVEAMRKAANVLIEKQKGQK